MHRSSRRDNFSKYYYTSSVFSGLVFFCFVEVISLELRLPKGTPLSFGLKTTLCCFFAFAAVLTVLEESYQNIIIQALFSQGLYFFCFVEVISLELRLPKGTPLSFGLKTTLCCFFAFAAVLIVLEEIKTRRF